MKTQTVTNINFYELLLRFKKLDFKFYDEIDVNIHNNGTGYTKLIKFTYVSLIIIYKLKKEQYEKWRLMKPKLRTATQI